MDTLPHLNLGLGGLPLLSDAETRSISAENPTGERGGGAKAHPDAANPARRLGAGWKVRPCITLAPNTITPLADIAGPGLLQHIWITVHPNAYRFFLDGDAEHPTICGTGTEDYFGGAWAFNGETYSTAFLGYPLFCKEPGEVPRHGLYRWHIFDPLRFKQNLKVTLQALGWWPDGTFQPLTDDIASMGYWYQREPHATFPALPPAHERWSR